MDDQDFFNFKSKNHKRDIDLQAFAKFVETTIPVNPRYTNQDVHPNVADDLQILEEIACGMDIWKREDLSTAPLRLKVFRKYANIFTNNQGAEPN
jgi:hypothetical protein